MEDDDDFYGEGGQDTGATTNENAADDSGDVKEEKMEDELEEGEEEESDDSDIDIITERKDDAEPVPPRNQYQSMKQEPRPSSTDVASRGGQQSTASRISTAPTPVQSQKLQDGSKFPEVHTSNVNVEADPMYEPAGKPISQVDIDADMAEHTKPWRLPGSDQSDYFNYGFDEFTWASYVIRQQTMATQLVSQKAETAQFQQMFGGGGMPGMPGPPAAPAAQQRNGGGDAAAMPGMPSEQEFMQMAQMMMANGQDPSNMDFGTFMQQFGGVGVGQGQGQGQGNYGNQNYQNQGSGQNAGSGGGGGNFGGGRGGRRGGRWN